MAEKASYAEQSKARLKDITDSIEAGIKELFQSDKYAKYLATMSRFHKYSVNNTMLIYMQKPDATLVAGFNKWKDQFSRNVLKGEKGIKIIAPTPFKKKIEQEKLDPDTKLPMLNPDGTVAMEEKTVQIPKYKVVSVFDVSQTDGKPLPELSAQLTGSVQNYEAFMEALQRSAPVPISVERMASDMDGFFSPDQQRIAIREGMSEVQTVCAAVHEIAHSKLHNYQKEKELSAAIGETAAPVKPKSRNTEEVEAESVSFAVCAYYGIATGENSFGYIATWSKDKELPELRASLETINKTASGLITDIDRNYAAVLKERGIDGKKDVEQQPGYETWSEPATAENTPEHPDTPSDDVSAYLPNLLYDRDAYTDGQWKKLQADAFAGQDVSLYAKPEFSLEQMEYVSGLIKQGYDVSAYYVEGKQISLIDRAMTADEISGIRRQVEYDGIPKMLYRPEQWAEIRKGMEKKLDVKQYTDPALSAAQMARLRAELEKEAAIFTEPQSNGDGIVDVKIETYDPSAPLPDFPADYPMPDPSVTIADRNAYGYTENDVLPLSHAKAAEFFEKDATIYMLEPGNVASMAFDMDDIDHHSGLFGIRREDWDNEREYLELAMGHELTDTELEKSFLNNPADAFAIYQLKHAEATRDLRFEPLERVTAAGLTVGKDNYELVYTGELPKDEAVQDVLDDIYITFNENRPEDFRGHSLSVSDVIALKQNGAISSHYVDRFGFTELPAFLKPENYLKNAEMAMEDDYGMIDGIVNNGPKQPTVAELEQQAKSGTPISLMDLAAAAHRERDGGRKEKRPSVLAQLRSYEHREKPQPAPKKSAEREI